MLRLLLHEAVFSYMFTNGQYLRIIADLFPTDHWTITVYDIKTAIVLSL